MFVLTKSGEAINTDFCAKFHILPDNPDRVSVEAFHVSLFPEGFTKEQVLFGGTLEECRAYVAEWAQALNHDFAFKSYIHEHLAELIGLIQKESKDNEHKN